MAINQIDELKRENLCLRKALEKLHLENKRLCNEIERIGLNCFDLMEGAGMPAFEIYESIWVWSVDILKGELDGQN